MFSILFRALNVNETQKFNFTEATLISRRITFFNAKDGLFTTGAVSLSNKKIQKLALPLSQPTGKRSVMCLKICQQQNLFSPIWLITLVKNNYRLVLKFGLYHLQKTEVLFGFTVKLSF